jgi:hypothetical protein
MEFEIKKEDKAAHLLMAFIVLVLSGLGIWKFVEIICWLINHVEINIK